MGFLGKLFKKDWRDIVKKGDKYLASGEKGLALQEYRSALKRLEEGSPDYNDIYEKVAEIAAELRQGHLQRAAQLSKAGEIERAYAAFESARAQSLSPESIEEVDELRAKLSAAVEEERKIPALHDESDEAGQEWNERDHFQVLLGGLPEAQAEEYEGYGDQFRRGWMALQAGDFDRAIELLEQAKESRPAPFLLTELGRAYHGQNQAERALELMRAADQEAGDEIYIKLRLVEVLWTLERHDEAEEVLQAAHDLDEENTEVFRAIGEHALRSGDYDPGIEAVELMLEDEPNNIGLLRMLGQLFQAKGELPQALDAYERVNGLRWSFDPENNELVFDATSALGAAQILLELEKKPDRAVELLSAVASVTIGLSRAAILVAMARAHMLKKRRKEARELLGKARELILVEGKQGNEEALDEIDKLTESTVKK